MLKGAFIDGYINMPDPPPHDNPIATSLSLLLFQTHIVMFV